MAAFRAAHAGETLFEIAALEKLADHLGDHVAEDAVAGLVALGIELEKLLEMGVDAAPERRSFRVAGLVDLLRHTAQCRKEPVPSNGTDPKKSEESEGCLPPPVLPDQAHRGHGAGGLCRGYLPSRSDFRRELEVSPRTLARDLDFLRDEERAPIEDRCAGPRIPIDRRNLSTAPGAAQPQGSLQLRAGAEASGRLRGHAP